MPKLIEQGISSALIARRRWGMLAGIGIGAVLVAAGLWALLNPQQPASSLEKAVAAIQRLKGEITQDENVPGKPIIKVSFRNCMFRYDANLADLRPHLEALGELRELDLVNTNITDQGLQELKSLTQLKTIQLGNNREGIGMGRPQLTGSAVEELRKFLPHTEVRFHERKRGQRTLTGNNVR